MTTEIETTNGTGRPDAWDHSRRCIAMKSDGSGRCKHYAIRGGKVCKYHGGAAPQVQRAATERVMSDLYGPMLAGLRRLLDSGDLDAIAKACAILARQYGNDQDANRLPADQKPGFGLDWLGYLDTDELHEITAFVADFEALARERREAGFKEWSRGGVGVAAPGPRALPVIDVTATSNGNGSNE